MLPRVCPPPVVAQPEADEVAAAVGVGVILEVGAGVAEDAVVDEQWPSAPAFRSWRAPARSPSAMVGGRLPRCPRPGLPRRLHNRGGKCSPHRPFPSRQTAGCLRNDLQAARDRVEPHDIVAKAFEALILCEMLGEGNVMEHVAESRLLTIRTHRARLVRKTLADAA